MGDWGRDWDAVVTADVGSVHEKTHTGWAFDADTRHSHVWVTVRCGPTPARRHVGNLVMLVEEWEQLRGMLLAGVEAVVGGDVEVSG